MKLIIDAMDEWEMSVESHNRVRAQISSFQPQISTREADLAKCDICYDRNTSHWWTTPRISKTARRSLCSTENRWNHSGRTGAYKRRLPGGMRAPCQKTCPSKRPRGVSSGHLLCTVADTLRAGNEVSLRIWTGSGAQTSFRTGR